MDKSINAIDVFLEKRKTKVYVGQLDFFEGRYRFVYDDHYLNSKQALSLGPQLSLLHKTHFSQTLFPFFEDRIPSRENPAYPDYCNATGIAVNESNPFILLPTIGRRGPSSFIFEPIYLITFTGADLQTFRKSLHLTLDEFSKVFDVSKASLHNAERGKSSGKEILKRLEIYKNFPAVALDAVRKRGKWLHDDKRAQMVASLRRFCAKGSDEKAARN